MIIPAIFAISPVSTEFGQGSTLMFTTMPQVFAGMPGGQVVGAVFLFLYSLQQLLLLSVLWRQLLLLSKINSAGSASRFVLVYYSFPLPWEFVHL